MHQIIIIIIVIIIIIIIIKCYVYVCLQKYGRDFLSEMSVFQL